MPTLLDTHYHLDFIPSLSMQVDFVQHMYQANTGIVAQTVLPSKFAALTQALDEFDEARPLLSLGYHPWWIPSGSQQEQEVERFNQYIHQTHLIGEIGLDYSPKRIAEVPASLQNQIFKQLLKSIQKAAITSHHSKPYVVSIHAVRSVTPVLDLIEQYIDVEQGIVPILHRFNGTSDELTRHIRLGGYISVEPRLLRTKKGKAYVQQIPKERLLLETDLPETIADQLLQVEDYVQMHQESMQTTLEALIRLLGEDIIETIQYTQQALYHYPSSIE